MDLVINVEGDVDTQEIAPMLLIPFVENSFKHGLGKQMAKGFVNVDLKADKENLHFSITNSKPVNGSAVSSQKGYQGGIGLKNVQKRLGLLYPKKYQLNINERPNEFNVSLDIKLN
jgi:LytS/YehU family sensor histidine kinase